MCGVCDPNSDVSFDIAHNTVALSNKTCRYYIDNCFHAIWINWKNYFPYMREIADFSLCNDKGQKVTSKHLYRLWTKDSSINVKDCGKDPNNCTELCNKSMSLFSASYESEGDPDFLRGIVWNLAETFGYEMDKTAFEVAKNQAKIRTDDELSAAEEARRIAEDRASTARRLGLKEKLPENEIYTRLLLLNNEVDAPLILNSNTEAPRNLQTTSTATPTTQPAPTSSATTAQPAVATTNPQTGSSTNTALASSTQSLVEGNPYTVQLTFNESGYPITMYN